MPLVVTINKFFDDYGDRCDVATCDLAAEKTVFVTQELDLCNAAIDDIQVTFAAVYNMNENGPVDRHHAEDLDGPGARGREMDVQPIPRPLQNLRTT